MHELSIAQALIDTVLQEMRQRGLPAVQTIVVRIGALSSVVPEALQFGYEALAADTPLARTRLQIEHVPVHGHCRACGREFQVRDFVFTCPACASGDIEVTRGEELDLAYLEIAEEG